MEGCGVFLSAISQTGQELGEDFGGLTGSFAVKGRARFQTPPPRLHPGAVLSLLLDKCGLMLPLTHAGVRKR